MTTQSPWRSALVSVGFVVWTMAATVLGFAIVDHATDSLPLLGAWLSSHWLVLLIGLIVNPAPFYRARQAIINAQKGTL